jgi:hypothetical protein
MSGHIIQLLIVERDRLERAIKALQGSSPKVVDIDDDPMMPDWVKPKAQVAAAPKKKGFSAATRRRMAEGQRRRYAAIRAAKAETAPVAVTPKPAPAKPQVAVKKGGLTEAGRKALSLAMKKRWAAKKRAAK